MASHIYYITGLCRDPSHCLYVRSLTLSKPYWLYHLVFTTSAPDTIIVHLLTAVWVISLAWSHLQWYICAWMRSAGFDCHIWDFDWSDRFSVLIYFVIFKGASSYVDKRGPRMSKRVETPNKSTFHVCVCVTFADVSLTKASYMATHRFNRSRSRFCLLLEGLTSLWRGLSCRDGRIYILLIYHTNLGQWSDMTGVSNLLASLEHTGRRRVVLGHTLNTLWHIITKSLIMF